MPKGRPGTLTTYEKVKAKKIRDFLSSNNISRFDRMNSAALLDAVRISDDRVFVSLDFHDDALSKITRFVDEIKS